MYKYVITKTYNCKPTVHVQTEVMYNLRLVNKQLLAVDKVILGARASRRPSNNGAVKPVLSID